MQVMRLGASAFGLSLAVALASCLSSTSAPCADLICPEGTTCVASAKTCVDTDLITACMGRASGETCFVPGAPDGVCRNSVCTTGNCGDGTIDGVEQCDGADIGDLTCLNLGFNEPGNLTCLDDCRYDTRECTGLCGDGTRNGLEFCEGSDLGGQTCLDRGFYGEPGLACADNCTFDTSACGGGFCGDEFLNGLEQCEKASMSSDCSALGFTGAQTGLGCTNACTFDATTSCLCVEARCKAFTETCVCNKAGGCGCQPVTTL